MERFLINLLCGVGREFEKHKLLMVAFSDGGKLTALIGTNSGQYWVHTIDDKGNRWRSDNSSDYWATASMFAEHNPTL